MIMREQVLQGFEEQRVLVDALTNVSIVDLCGLTVLKF